jgi:GTP cyclohydrolase I
MLVFKVLTANTTRVKLQEEVVVVAPVARALFTNLDSIGVVVVIAVVARTPCT